MNKKSPREYSDNELAEHGVASETARLCAFPLPLVVVFSPTSAFSRSALPCLLPFRERIPANSHPRREGEYYDRETKRIIVPKDGPIGNALSSSHAHKNRGSSWR